MPIYGSRTIDNIHKLLMIGSLHMLQAAVWEAKYGCIYIRVVILNWSGLSAVLLSFIQSISYLHTCTQDFWIIIETVLYVASNMALLRVQKIRKDFNNSLLVRQLFFSSSPRLDSSERRKGRVEGRLSSPQGTHVRCKYS